MRRPQRFIIVFDKDGDAESIYPEHMSDNVMDALVQSMDRENPDDGAPFSWGYVEVVKGVWK